ncbi:MAG: PqqD family protein [Actinomycetota bacterium]|nr:PqqD family protein [Actinomycetota bacterium]
MDIGDYPLRGLSSASCSIDGQTLIVEAKNKKLFVLNAAGTKIWELSDGRHTIEDIITKIKLSSKKNEHQVRKETEDFIESLVERQVLVLLKQPLDVVA